MSREERILLFIPVFNCERQIGRVLSQLDERILRFVDEVLVIDNRSSDRTIERVLESVSAQEPGAVSGKLTLIRNRKNAGLGGSHKVAFRYAAEHGFDFVIVLHGDDQAAIEDLLPLLLSGEFRRYDCLLGSRFARGARRLGYSRVRTAGNLALNLACTLALRRHVSDMGSGLNLYRISALERCPLSDFPDDRTFNVFFLFYILQSGWRSAFFPLSWREEDQTSNAKAFRQGKKILGLAARRAVFGLDALRSPARSALSEPDYEILWPRESLLRRA